MKNGILWPHHEKMYFEKNICVFKVGYLLYELIQVPNNPFLIFFWYGTFLENNCQSGGWSGPPSPNSSILQIFKNGFTCIILVSSNVYLPFFVLFWPLELLKLHICWKSSIFCPKRAYLKVFVYIIFFVKIFWAELWSNKRWQHSWRVAMHFSN